MKIEKKALLLVFIIFLVPLSGCINDETGDEVSETNSNQENTEILFEGDEPGECSDQADNDRDGLFDCDDPNCYGAEICRLNSNNNSDNYSQEDCERRGGNWTSAADRGGQSYCDFAEVRENQQIDQEDCERRGGKWTAIAARAGEYSCANPDDDSLEPRP